MPPMFRSRRVRPAVVVSGVVIALGLFGAAPALAQPPPLPFTHVVQPPPGARICSPPAVQSQGTVAFGGARPPQHWFVKADDSGSLTVTLVLESELGFDVRGVRAQVFDAANAWTGDILITEGTPLSSSLTLGPTGPGAVYRVSVTPAAVGNPPFGCQCPSYRLEFLGAVQAGIWGGAGLPGTGPLRNLVHAGSTRWVFNVGPDEPLWVRVSPSEFNEGRYLFVLVDPTGERRLDEFESPPSSQALPRDVYLAAAGGEPGPWTLYMFEAEEDQHSSDYVLSKLAGADRGVYAVWYTAGNPGGSVLVRVFQGAEGSTPFPHAVEVTTSLIRGVIDSEAYPVHDGMFVEGNVIPGAFNVVRIDAPPGWTVTEAPETAVFTCGGDTTLTIRVQDLTPPVLAVPEDMTVEATGATGAAVEFTASATDLDVVTVPVAVTCTPASGSTFPIGMTPVTCTASDGYNTTTGRFTVTVALPASTLDVRSTMGGSIAIPGGIATFGLVASSSATGMLRGSVEYQDHAVGLNLKSTEILAVVVTGTQARIYGLATINGAGSHYFVVDVNDLGEPGIGVDTFAIQIGTGYAAGPAALRGGNIQIRR